MSSVQNIQDKQLLDCIKRYAQAQAYEFLEIIAPILAMAPITLSNALTSEVYNLFIAINLSINPDSDERVVESKTRIAEMQGALEVEEQGSYQKFVAGLARAIREMFKKSPELPGREEFDLEVLTDFFRSKNELT